MSKNLLAMNEYWQGLRLTVVKGKSILEIIQKRQKPKLNRRYNITFDQLPIYLKELLDNDFIFSDHLLRL